MKTEITPKEIGNSYKLEFYTPLLDLLVYTIILSSGEENLRPCVDVKCWKLRFEITCSPMQLGVLFAFVILFCFLLFCPPQSSSQINTKKLIISYEHPALVSLVSSQLF